ncbi:PorV/PorQ family protein [Rosettibacter firmus]|uniref:PorV/PorQ family protein n=1 Tax=Rosettibacter firmus TaxID=3111522 RepID=UPI00336C3029
MKTIKLLLILVYVLAGILQAQQKQKLAQSGFQFLSVVSDAKASAMGEAMTSLQFGSSALFFNPAGMSDMQTFVDVSVSSNKWIADINHYTLSLAINPYNGNYGVIGFTIQSVDYGEFYGTRVNKASPLGYDDIGIFKLSALAIGIGYAKQLSDKFSVGGQIRWVHQDLGESIIPVINTGVDTSQEKISNKLSPLVFDFGTQYRTGFKSLVFGMSVRNFSSEVKYAKEGFQAPLVFTLGISMNLLDLINELPYNQSLYLSVDASHHRDHPEQIKVGIDYKIFNAFSIRVGYMSNNFESAFTYGLGISKYGFTFDYSYTPFGVFDKVQRFTARFSL